VSVMSSLAHLPVADPFVDRVRRRVGEIRVEEARAKSRGQQPPAHVGDERRRVSVPTMLARCIDGTDADPRAGRPGVARKRDGFIRDNPEPEARVVAREADSDVLLGPPAPPP